MVLKLSINKELWLYLLVTLSLSDILPKCAKTSEPEDKQLCIAVHTINNNIHDADPLDKSSSKAQINLHCLTQHM